MENYSKSRRMQIEQGNLLIFNRKFFFIFVQSLKEDRVAESLINKYYFVYSIKHSIEQLECLFTKFFNL